MCQKGPIGGTRDGTLKEVRPNPRGVRKRKNMRKRRKKRWAPGDVNCLSLGSLFSRAFPCPVTEN